MTSSPEERKARTKAFALRDVRMVSRLPRGMAADVMSRQLLRAATSMGANYRAACRARSRAEFIARMGVVEEEADETLYWMELMVAAGLVEENRVGELMAERREILAMVIASIRTGRASNSASR